MEFRLHRDDYMMAIIEIIALMFDTVVDYEDDTRDEH